MVVERNLMPQFRRSVKDSVEGCVLKPLLHTYLFGAEFPDEFSISFRKEEHVREPDGWFHPSTHPLWPARMLYYYLTEPDSLIFDPREYMGTLSVVMGKAVHGFIGVCLDHMGVRITAEELRAEGIDCNDLGEPRVKNESAGSRGETDGILKLHLPNFPHCPRQNFEFKSSNPMTLRNLPDLNIEAFKEKWPDYWAQQQEYLALLGYEVSVVLIMSLGFPWEMREFHIPAEPYWQKQVRDKYLMVREAARDGDPPQPCCGARSKEAKACPARSVCPVAAI